MSRSEDRTIKSPADNTQRSQVANPASKTARPGLSRPLIELIDMPSPEQFRTIARILGLVNVVEQRLGRESAERKAAGESAA